MRTDRATVPTGRLLRDDAEFAAAHTELLALLDANPDPGTANHDRLEYLTVLIEAYDRTRSTIGDEPASPQDLVEFALEQRGLTRTDLAELMGGKSRVSEFFSGARPLSISQIRAIRAELGIPADLLIPHDALLDRTGSAEQRARRATRHAVALTEALGTVTRTQVVTTGRFVRGSAEGDARKGGAKGGTKPARKTITRKRSARG